MHCNQLCVSLLSNCLSCRRMQPSAKWPVFPLLVRYACASRTNESHPHSSMRYVLRVRHISMQPDEGDAYGRETTVLDDVDMTAAPLPDADARGSFARGFGGSSGSGFGRPSGGGFGASSGRMMGTVPMTSFARVGSMVYNQSGGGGGASAATPEARHSVSTRARTHTSSSSHPQTRDHRVAVRSVSTD